MQVGNAVSVICPALQASSLAAFRQLIRVGTFKSVSLKY